jgi:ribosome-binding factor A
MSRADRVASYIKRQVSDIIQMELSDPRLRFVTITDIELTKDLRFAKLYFSALGEKPQKDAAEKALKSACGFIRNLIGQRIRLRFVPELMFKLDESCEQSLKIEKILQEINESRKKDGKKQTRPSKKK